jgi:DNA-binding transcriptional LysR family regulator
MPSGKQAPGRFSNPSWDATTTGGCDTLDGVELDLAQVRAFVAVVDHAHFGRAAQTLSLSQQALSKRVARLEAGLGPLLERRHGGVVPTPAGERLLPAARQLLEVADRAVADVRGTPPAPLRVDAWGELQTPARALREIARAQPGLVVELSMRRDLREALAALERHEIDLAFGNVADLGRPLPGDLTAELVMSDPLALLVNAHGTLAGRDHVSPRELTRIWWPTPGSSQELRGFAERYTRSIGAELVTDGANLGLEALVARVAADPELVSVVVAEWPVDGHADVRVVPLQPPPEYPWYAVWRTAGAHPSLPRVLRALRTGQKP